MKRFNFGRLFGIILGIIYLCFSINSILAFNNYNNARIEAKVIIAEELEIKYSSKKKLDKQMIMRARYYSSSLYEDVKITFKKDSASERVTLYSELASNAMLYDKESAEYLEYVKVLNAVDSFILYQEEHDSLFIAIGKMNLKILYVLIIFLIVITVMILGLYFFACYWSKRKLTAKEYFRALYRGIKKEYNTYFYS